MHCPRCGQQQANEQIKFCSRCGFPLVVIADVVAHGGSLPQLDALNAAPSKWLTKGKGMGFSLIWFIFFLLIMTPFWGFMDVDVLTGMSAIIAIFGGLLIFLASAIFLEGKPKPVPAFYKQPPLPSQQYNPQQHPAQHHQQQQMANQMGGQHYQPNALPPQQSQPVSTYIPPHVAGSWRDTNDLIREQSMEDKTKMLTREEENNR